MSPEDTDVLVERVQDALETVDAQTMHPDAAAALDQLASRIREMEGALRRMRDAKQATCSGDIDALKLQWVPVYGEAAARLAAEVLPAEKGSS